MISKITLDNSSFRNEAKNYKGLFYDKLEQATIYLKRGQYKAMNEVLTNISTNFELNDEELADYPTGSYYLQFLSNAKFVANGNFIKQ